MLQRWHRGFACFGFAESCSRKDRTTRSRRRRGQRGIALILALLVLSILVVVVVQFSYSVKVESRIVQNGREDQAMSVAARGAIAYVAALFRDDNKNEKTPANVDSLADCWNDPNLPDLMKLTLGDTTLNLTVVDLDQRLSLDWLTIDARQAFMTTALKRLLDKLGVDGDHDKISKAIRDKVRETAGCAAITDSANGTAAPAPAPSPSPKPGPDGETPPAKRGILDLDELLTVEVENVDMKKVIWGDVTASPVKVGISQFVTCWCTDTINVNTAPAEVLFAILPNNNADTPPKSLWDDASSKAVVEGIQKKRIDPLYAQQGGDSATTGSTPNTGAAGANGANTGAGASKSWQGKPIEKLTDLNTIPLLATMFGGTAAGAAGTPGTPAQPAQPTQPATPANPASPQQGSTAFGFKTALAVASHYYAIVVKASSSSGATKTVRMVVARNTQDEVAPLLVREDPR